MPNPPLPVRQLVAHRHAVGDSSGHSLSSGGCRERKCHNRNNRYHDVKSHSRGPLVVAPPIKLAFTKEAIWRPRPAHVRRFQKAAVAKCR